MDLDRAIDVFGAAFCYTRSYTHPFEYVRVGDLRVMRDTTRRSGDYRVQEIIPFGISPEEAVRQILEYHPARFFVCAVHGPDEDENGIKVAYKSHHFRLLRKEPLFVYDLDSTPISSTSYPIIRITTKEGAEAVHKIAGREILDKDLHEGDADVRLYAAFEGESPIGWVKSIRGPYDARWVSNLHVQPDHRRKGIGKSLMLAMLADDKHFGSKWSVLLASTLGSHLYPAIGYKQIGLLQLFAPDKTRWT